MPVEVGPVMPRFMIIFIQDFGNDLNRLLVVELRVVMQRFMRRLVRMGVLVVMIMIVVMMMVVIPVPVVVMVMVVLRNGAAAIFTHCITLLLEF